MALYRTKPFEPKEAFSRTQGFCDGESCHIVSEKGKIIRVVFSNNSIYSSGFEKHELLELEPIEPSPDIQKRAEDLFPIIKKITKGGEFPSYIDDNKLNRNKALQLAIEAVAAEREKYEGEISFLKSKLQDCEHKIAIEAQIAEEVKNTIKEMKEKHEEEIMEMRDYIKRSPQPDEYDFERYPLPICFDPTDEAKELYRRKQKIQRDFELQQHIKELENGTEKLQANH